MPNPVRMSGRTNGESVKTSPNASVGSMLASRNIKIFGPLSQGKLNGIGLPPVLVPKFEQMLKGIRYFVVGKGIDTGHISKVFRLGGFSKITARGGALLAIGNAASVLPAPEKSLASGSEAIKSKNFGQALEEYFLAMVAARDLRSQYLIDARATIIERLGTNLPAIAEHLIRERAPFESMAIFLELGEHQLNLALLKELARFSSLERKFDRYVPGSKEHKKLIKKEKLGAAIQQAFLSGNALEAEAELGLRLRESFPREISYQKHLIVMDLGEGNLRDAECQLEELRTAGGMDREMIGQVDVLRNNKIAQALERSPGIKGKLDKLFSKLSSGNLTPEEYEQLKQIGIGIDYLIDRSLKLLDKKRYVAYQTVTRLSELVGNGMEAKIQELRLGIIGRMINDAIRGDRISKEEEALLSDRGRLTEYAKYNPQRLEIFLENIRDVLLRAQKNKREAVNSGTLKTIYKLALVEAGRQPAEDSLEVIWRDGESKKIESDDDCLDAGWAAIAFGEPERAFEMAQIYSRNFPGFAGYEIELAALAELSHFGEAEKRLEMLRPLLDHGKIERIEAMVKQKTTFTRIDADGQFLFLVRDGNKTVSINGKRFRLRAFDADKVNKLVALGIHYQSAREYIFDRLTSEFLEEAKTIGGAHMVISFLAGLLIEMKNGVDKFLPAYDRIDQLIRDLNSAVVEIIRQDQRLTVDALGQQLTIYNKILAHSYRFIEIAQVMEAMLPEGPEIEIKHLASALAAAINYGNAGEVEQAWAIHLKIERLYQNLSAPEKARLKFSQSSDQDYFAQNFAFMANLGRTPAEIEQYLEKARTSDPTSHTTNSNIAAALIAIGKFREAEPILRKVLTCKSDLGLSVHGLAVILIETGRAGEAFTRIKEYIKERPEGAPTLAWLNDILFRLSQLDFEEAGKMLLANHEQFDKQSLGKLTWEMPAFIRNRLSPDFLTYLKS